MRHGVQRAVAASLSATALLAIGILLFGDFGETEGRILATTGLLAAFGLLALPGAILVDRGRSVRPAAAFLALVAAGLALSLVAVWLGDVPEELAKTVGTVASVAVAAAQPAALHVRRRPDDRVLLDRLFAASSVLVAVLAVMFSVALWAELDSDGYFRVFGALVVLDALLVALQPVVAFTRPPLRHFRVRLLVDPGGLVETSVEAPDFAGAAAKAIRSVEEDGGRVLRLERSDRRPAVPG